MKFIFLLFFLFPISSSAQDNERQELVNFVYDKLKGCDIHNTDKNDNDANVNVKLSLRKNLTIGENKISLEDDAKFIIKDLKTEEITPYSFSNTEVASIQDLDPNNISNRYSDIYDLHVLSMS